MDLGPVPLFPSLFWLWKDTLRGNSCRCEATKINTLRPEPMLPVPWLGLILLKSPDWWLTASASALKLAYKLESDYHQSNALHDFAPFHSFLFSVGRGGHCGHLTVLLLLANLNRQCLLGLPPTPFSSGIWGEMLFPLFFLGDWKTMLINISTSFPWVSESGSSSYHYST